MRILPKIYRTRIGYSQLADVKTFQLNQTRSECLYVGACAKDKKNFYEMGKILPVIQRSFWSYGLLASIRIMLRKYL